jgi:hypothetical protein
MQYVQMIPTEMCGSSWDSKIWSWVPRVSEHRMNLLAKSCTSSPDRQPDKCWPYSIWKYHSLLVSWSSKLVCKSAQFESRLGSLLVQRFKLFPWISSDTDSDAEIVPWNKPQPPPFKFFPIRMLFTNITYQLYWLYSNELYGKMGWNCRRRCCTDINLDEVKKSARNQSQDCR